MSRLTGTTNALCGFTRAHMIGRVTLEGVWLSLSEGRSEKCVVGVADGGRSTGTPSHPGFIVVHMHVPLS